MLRVLTSGVAFLCLTSAAAMACRGPDSFTTIFFDEVPKLVFDARGNLVAPPPVAAMIAITHMNETPAICTIEDPYCTFQVGMANVKQVLKGQIEQQTIKIVAAHSDCTGDLRVGDTGIVIGNFRKNAQGELELVLMFESRYGRRLRESATK
jgi:hypothetical protein